MKASRLKSSRVLLSFILALGFILPSCKKEAPPPDRANAPATSTENQATNSEPSATPTSTQDQTATKETNAQDSPPMAESPSFEIIERKYLNDALIFSVSMVQLDNAEEIAKELVKENNNEYMVRIFFYTPDLTPGTDMPLIRYEWTKYQGLVKNYDLRLPAPSNERDTSLPKYQVLFKIKQIYNGRVYGDVLIESLSRSTKPDTLESIARAICKQESIDDVCLYNNRDAYEANMSAAYLKKHPDALKKGFLGTLKDDEFISGTDLYPD